MIAENDPENMWINLAGFEVLVLAETGSTNDDATIFSEQVDGEFAVWAKFQNAGRGRENRHWQAAQGCSLTFSLVLRPGENEIAFITQFTALGALALADLLSSTYGLPAEIKWPNDVLIGGKKVCGILAQMKMSGQAVDFVVVGIGINVNLAREQFPQDIQEIATALAIEAGREISRPELIIRLYENMTKWYRELIQNGFASVRERWLNRSEMIDKTVSIVFHNEAVSGKAVGLDEDGSLILLTANNQKMSVSAGDATILKEVNTYAAGN